MVVKCSYIYDSSRSKIQKTQHGEEHSMGNEAQHAP